MIKLYRADCLVAMPKILPQSIDLILVDPPYGTSCAKWDTIINFNKLWIEYRRIIKPNGTILIFSNNLFTIQLINSNLAMYRYRWFWNKLWPSGFQLANKRPMSTIEEICVFSIKQGNYYPIKTKREKPVIQKMRKKSSLIHSNNMSGSLKLYDTKHPTNLIEFVKDARNKQVHPTQKPIELLKYLIKTYTKQEDTVLDNCMGSGSTGCAARLLGRNFIGIELDSEYYKIAASRIKEIDYEIQTY